MVNNKFPVNVMMEKHMKNFKKNNSKNLINTLKCLKKSVSNKNDEEVYNKFYYQVKRWSLCECDQKSSLNFLMSDNLGNVYMDTSKDNDKNSFSNAKNGKVHKDKIDSLEIFKKMKNSNSVLHVNDDKKHVYMGYKLGFSNNTDAVILLTMDL